MASDDAYVSAEAIDDAYDSAEWLAAALCYPELATHQILRFTNPWWNPPWRDLIPDDPPPPARGIDIRWGSYGKRVMRSRPVVAVARSVKRGEVACSPETPFEFGSRSGAGSASMSGGEEGAGSAAAAAAAAKRRRVGDRDDDSGAGSGCETKEFEKAGIETAPFVCSRSRMAKKKTLCELEEEEKLLLEEKETLQKEMELRRIAYDFLRTENQRLKSQQLSLQSERVSVASRPRTHFILPDLNEPLLENSY